MSLSLTEEGETNTSGSPDLVQGPVSYAEGDGPRVIPLTIGDYYREAKNLIPKIVATYYSAVAVHRCAIFAMYARDLSTGGASYLRSDRQKALAGEYNDYTKAGGYAGLIYTSSGNSYIDKNVRSSSSVLLKPFQSSHQLEGSCFRDDSMEQPYSGAETLSDGSLVLELEGGMNYAYCLVSVLYRGEVPVCSADCRASVTCSMATIYGTFGYVLRRSGHNDKKGMKKSLARMSSATANDNWGDTRDITYKCLSNLVKAVTSAYYILKPTNIRQYDTANISLMDPDLADFLARNSVLGEALENVSS